MVLEPDVYLEKQHQLDYCIYMIVTSYFKKVTVDDDRMLRRLYVSYKGMKNDKQIKLEENVIYAVEHYVLPSMKVKTDDLIVSAKLRKYKDQFVLHIYNKDVYFIVYGNYIDDLCTKIKLTVKNKNDENSKNKKLDNNKKIENAKWIDF